MSEQPATPHTIDPNLAGLAAQLAGCQIEQLLAVAWRDDDLVVVVSPGPKYIFTAQQVYNAGWRGGKTFHAHLAPVIEPEQEPEHHKADKPPRPKKT